ncbi:MAG: hypothetical protein R3E98_02725 [Gemmatimonadota bacterium]
MGAGAALAIVAAPLAAQYASGPSVLSLLPTTDRVASAGTDRTGRLGEGDYVLPGGQALQAWQVRGRAGEGLVLELTSEDFDAYLYMLGPGLDEPQTDDDGSTGCGARIDIVLPADGPYTLVLSSLSGQAGEYRLRVANEAGPRQDSDECMGADTGGGWDWAVDDVPTDGRTLVDGDVVEDQLSLDDHQLPDGSAAKAWTVLGTAGMTLSIDMLSDDFDSILYASGPGLSDRLIDDDGAGGCNARLTITFPEDGEYRVVASSIFGGAAGAFTLRVAASPEPPAAQGCDPR